MQSGWITRGVARRKGVLSALVSLLAVVASPADAGQIAGIDISDDRIVVRFNDVVERASSFVLGGPDRIALDVAGADRGAPAIPGGRVTQVRQGFVANGTTRIVFDMAMPAKVLGGTFSEDGRALTLALAPLSPGGIANAIAAPRKTYLPPEEHRASPPRSRYNITIPLSPVQSSLPRPRIQGPAGRPLVVIDAGHGGHDPGAIGAGGIREKDVTLTVAKAIRDELLAGGRVRVALTRDDDRFLVLEERAPIARGVKADLFISVHADSAPDTSATGATIYTLSEVASDRTAAALAARENKADIINGVNLGGESSDVSSILIDLTQRETMNASARFADLVKRESGTVPFRRDYHRMAGFVVLKAPDIPAILLEVGYVTNPTDVARLNTPAARKAIGTALRKATDALFARRMASR